MRLTALIIVKNVDPMPAAMQQAAVNRHSADSDRAAVLIVTIVSRYTGRTCACGGGGTLASARFIVMTQLFPSLPAPSAREEEGGRERATLISFDLPLRRAAAAAISDEDAANIITPSTRGGFWTFWTARASSPSLPSQLTFGTGSPACRFLNTPEEGREGRGERER